MGTSLSLSRPQSSLSSSQPTDWFSAFFQYYLREQSQLQGRRRVFKCGAAEETIKCERHISLGGFGGPPPGNFLNFERFYVRFNWVFMRLEPDFSCYFLSCEKPNAGHNCFQTVTCCFFYFFFFSKFL